MLFAGIVAVSIAVVIVCGILAGAHLRRARRTRSAAEPIVNPAITMQSPLPAMVVAQRRRLARGSQPMPLSPIGALRPSHVRR